MSQIIIDANIISVAQLQKKPQWLLDWLDGLPVRGHTLDPHL